MGFLDSSYINDAISAATRGLGLDSGGNAVKTAENLFKQTTPPPSVPATQAPAVLSATQSVASSAKKFILGMDQKTLLIVGAVAVVALLIMQRRK